MRFPPVISAELDAEEQARLARERLRLRWQRCVLKWAAPACPQQVRFLAAVAKDGFSASRRPRP